MKCNRYSFIIMFIALVTTTASPMFVDVPVSSSSSSSSSSNVPPAVVFPGIRGQQHFLFPPKQMIELCGIGSCRCKISLAAAKMSPTLRNMMDDCIDPVDSLFVPFSQRTLSIIAPILELIATAREQKKSEQYINDRVLVFYKRRNLTAEDSTDIGNAFNYLCL